MPLDIYLDHAATSPLDRRVADAMSPWSGTRFGNPSAAYARGRDAAAVVERAREQVAAALNCRTTEAVFTSGGSESINAAIKGIAFAQSLARLGSHIVVSTIEHHAVLHTCQYLEAFGFDTTLVDVGNDGLVDPDDVARAIRADTVLVSIMHANNEVGTLQPIAEIVRAVRARAAALGRVVPVHTDAVQSPLWCSVDVSRLEVDSLSLSAHKFGGPTGGGVLFLRRGIPFLPQQSGGGQERQRRAGTEHVAGIVGTGEALALAEQERPLRVETAERLRQQLLDGIQRRFPSAVVNGHPTLRLPNILNVSFPGVEGDRLVEQLDLLGVAASSGSACASQSWEPSHVLLAMGLSLETAAAGIRFSLGTETQSGEIETALQRLPEAVAAAAPIEVA
jgi:cysteine desulfurase